MLRCGVINVLVLIILSSFLVTIIHITSVEKLEENNKVEKKTVEGAETSPYWDKVKIWAGKAFEKLPSFKKTKASASQ